MERFAPQFEVIRVIVLEDSPCCQVPHRVYPRLKEQPDLSDSPALPRTQSQRTSSSKTPRLVRLFGVPGTPPVLGTDLLRVVQRGFDL